MNSKHMHLRTGGHLRSGYVRAELAALVPCFQLARGGAAQRVWEATGFVLAEIRTVLPIVILPEAIEAGLDVAVPVDRAVLAALVGRQQIASRVTAHPAGRAFVVFAEVTAVVPVVVDPRPIYAGIGVTIKGLRR